MRSRKVFLRALRMYEGESRTPDAQRTRESERADALSAGVGCLASWCRAPGDGLRAVYYSGIELYVRLAGQCKTQELVIPQQIMTVA